MAHAHCDVTRIHPLESDFGDEKQKSTGQVEKDPMALGLLHPIARLIFFP